MLPCYTLGIVLGRVSHQFSKMEDFKKAKLSATENNEEITRKKQLPICK